MKTKKLSKKTRLKSKTLIITAMFLLFSSFPINALKKDKATEKKVVQPGYSLTITVASSNPLDHSQNNPGSELTPTTIPNSALACKVILSPQPSSKCGEGNYPPGETITLIVPQDIDGRNIVTGTDEEEYIFYEWILVEGKIGDYVPGGPGETSWDVKRNQITERYVNPLSFTITENTEIIAHFMPIDSVPIIERFPVNGPHNTGFSNDEEIMDYDRETRLFTSGYACGNKFVNNECHEGSMDIHAPIGEPVFAVQGGKIFAIETDNSFPGAGNYVIIKDKNGWLHVYLHLSAYCENGIADTGRSLAFNAAVRADIANYIIGACTLDYLNQTNYLKYLNGIESNCSPTRPPECTTSFNVGDDILAGTIIGFVGDTGATFAGPHIHYEVFPYYGEEPTNEYPTDNCPKIYEGNCRGDCHTIITPFPFLYPLENDNVHLCTDPTFSLDLSFVIDSSGSMWDDIDNVKDRMDDILAALEEHVGDYRISIVDFKHYNFPYSPYAARVALDFTNANGNSSILSAIDSLDASGGTSPGEAVYAGLMCSFTDCSFGAGSGMSKWREDALKIAILLGDEPPYTGEQEYTFDQVVEWAQAGGIPLPPMPPNTVTTTDGIHIYSILIGNNSTAKYYFKKLAEDTGGKFFNALTANDVVDAILEAIGAIDPGGPGNPTNSAPDVSGATASVSNIWPPNNKMVDIQILDVVDPDGDPVTITITAITQDEPINQTGSKNKEPDAEGIGTDTAWVRAERDGNGNGRVYKITFEASDDKGATAEGSVKVCVPHDQGEDTVCIDDGQNYDSTSFK